MTTRALDASRDKLANVLRIDGEIKHLETVLRVERHNGLFARNYWRQRVEQAKSTPGLLPAQMGRLEKLLKQLEMYSVVQNSSDPVDP